jgi:transposase
MQTICGVDVSKASLDSWAVGRYQGFDYDAAGAEQLAAFCREHDVDLVVMEASGGVEQAVFLALWKLGQPCAIANPRAVRSFADAMGKLEKTDRIDAEMIARYAATKGLVATPPPSEEQRQLTDLTARLRQITADLSVQKQRVHSTTNPTALASLRDTIAFFERQAKAFAAQIAALVTVDPLWCELDKTIRSFKGVAGRTVAVLLADLPEIGTLSNKAITKLVGLAPLANDSGKRNGRRSVRGGRASVRSILFLVAAIAAKYDRELANFRDRLLAQGKAKMVVRVALAHKLLVRLNARARETRAKLAQAA